MHPFEKKLYILVLPWGFFDISLKGNVIIVDTPGIGDEDQEEVAKMMLDYIPKAVAIMFVLNVANAGGIQRDRVFICLFNSNFPSVFLDIPCFWKLISNYHFSLTGL